MKTKSITLDELRNMIKNEIKKIDEVKLYFGLKKRKLIRMNTQLENIKLVIVLYKIKLPINSQVFMFFKGCGYEGALSALHCLGDNNILVLKRDLTDFRKGLPNEWCLSEYFIKILKEIGVL